MSRHRNKDEAGVGEDSFLDTTANLVGILIILVVVIGTKTRMDAELLSKQIAEEDHTEQLAAPKAEARALAESLQDQQIELREYQMEKEYRKRERDQVMQLVAFAKADLEERMSEVDDHQRAMIEQQRKEDELRKQLSDVQEEMGAKEDRKRPEIVLEHLPTPMAKTVFTREMHIQLQDGLVTVIPWDRLIDMLKEQVPLAARRRSSRQNIEDSLGPVGGFLMRYRMDAIPGGFALDRFELQCTPGAPRESVDEALASAGRLSLELASRDPAETVITVWVYPDSFEQFRQLKSRLFELGFLCAARPLPDGVRIGASPQGTRSSAQ